MKIKFKSFVHAKRYSLIFVCGIAAVLQLGQLADYAQTNIYLFTGSETNITLSPGTYGITAYGAQGGTAFYEVYRCGSGGQGAKMEAEFSFSGRTTLTLMVGGGGASNP